MTSSAAAAVDSRRWEIGITLLVGLVAAVWLLWKLGQGTLTPWDEAFYAEVAREMVESGDWLTPHFNFEPCFEKPPLVMWCDAVLFSLFGLTEFCARVTSAVAGVGLALLVYLIGKRVYDRTAGLLAVAVLLTNYQFVNNARWGTTDVLLTCLITLCVFGYLRLLTGSEKWWYLIGVAFALAVLAKGTPAVVAPAVILIDLIVGRRLVATLRSKHFWAAMLIAVAIAAPWFISMYVLHRDLFRERIYFNLIVRTTQSIEQHTGGPGYYIEALQRHFFPWVYLAPFALAVAVRENLAGRTASRVLLILAAVVFGIFTLVLTKIEWYILPMYPALAIFIGFLLSQATRSPRSLGFVGLAVATCVTVLFVSYKFTLILGAAICVLLVASALRKQLLHRWILAAMTAFLAAAGTTTLRPLYHKQEYSAAKLARLAASTGDEDREPLLILETHGLRHPTVIFYSHRPFRIAESADQVRNLLNGQEPSRLLLLTNELRSLSASCEVREVARDGAFAYVMIAAGSDQNQN